MIFTALMPDFFMLRSRSLSNGIATSTVGIPYSMFISSIAGGSWICDVPLFMLTQPGKTLRDTIAQFLGGLPLTAAEFGDQRNHPRVDVGHQSSASFPL
jgi:hypothetical protein